MIRALALALLPTAVMADPVESTFRILSRGEPVVATLLRPDADTPPVALLLHGFTGQRHEATVPSLGQGVFAHTAARLADAGIASLRIDFRGSGDSTAGSTFAETTPERQIADAAAALTWIGRQSDLDGTSVHVVGWSFGGLVAASLAGRDDRVASVSLWNPVALPRATFEGILGAQIFAAGLATAPDAPVPDAQPSLNGAFFAGVADADPVAAIARFSGPAMIAQGTDDPVIPDGSAEALAAAHPGPQVLWQPPMDHAFDIDEGSETLDALIDRTIATIRRP